MALFPNMVVESVVQVGDRTRLNASRSISNDPTNPIVKLEIQPEATSGWFQIDPTIGYLDWEYSVAGLKVAAVRVTAQDGTQASASRFLSSISASDDNLFSDDSDLISWEPRILEFIRGGRTSFKDMHREAQTQILDWLYEQNILDSKGQRLLPAAVVDVREVREWSKFLVMQIIFEGLTHSPDDTYSKKALKYSGYSAAARDRSALKLDLNGDGQIEDTEKVDVTSISAVRR